MIARHIEILTSLRAPGAYLEVRYRPNGKRHAVVIISWKEADFKPIGEETLERWAVDELIEPIDPWSRKKYVITEVGRSFVARNIPQEKPRCEPRWGYPGVRKYFNKYISEAKIDGRTKYLGLFNTPEEAYRAREAIRSAAR